jgi:Holliday junction resolvasome RuvABC endonuclease subunit
MRRPEPSDAFGAGEVRGGVLCLDLATRTGWAYADALAVSRWPCSKPFQDQALIPPEPRPPASFGTLLTGKPTSSHGERAHALAHWLDEMQRTNSPGIIVIEQPMPAKFSRNLAATQIAIGLSMVVQSHAHRHGCSFRQVPIISAKAWFGSKLQKNKAPMIECARRLGWEVETDHEADALAILDLTLARAEIARRYGDNLAASNAVAKVKRRQSARVMR